MTIAYISKERKVMTMFSFLFCLYLGSPEPSNGEDVERKKKPENIIVFEWVWTKLFKNNKWSVLLQAPRDCYVMAPLITLQLFYNLLAKCWHYLSSASD